MPTYEYTCENKDCELESIERIARVADRGKAKCYCGQPLKLKISLSYLDRSGIPSRNVREE